MNEGIIKNTYKVSYEAIDGSIKNRYLTRESSEEVIKEMEADSKVKELRELKYIKSGIYYW